jgi:hypothetical protein
VPWCRRETLYRVAASGGVVVALAVATAVFVPGYLPLPDTVSKSPPAGASRQRVSTATTTSLGGLPPLVPTATAPLRVLEIGDSLGIDLGDQLQSQLDATGMVRTTVASLGDTGLANVSFYDWPAQLATLLIADRPQVVVVFIGANDDQGLLVDGLAAAPGSPSWATAYAQRVDDVLRESTTAGARVVWIGMPPMQSPDLNAAMKRQNMIYSQESARFPGTLYIASTPVLGTSSGLFQLTGVDLSGQQVALRTPDGVHLTPAGAALLANAVIDTVERRWDISLGCDTLIVCPRTCSSPVSPWLIFPPQFPGTSACSVDRRTSWSATVK